MVIKVTSNYVAYQDLGLIFCIHGASSIKGQNYGRNWSRNNIYIYIYIVYFRYFCS